MPGRRSAEWLWVVSLGLAVATWAGGARAEQKPLTADLVDGSKMRIDGLLSDWSGTPIDLNQTVNRPPERLVGHAD